MGKKSNIIYFKIGYSENVKRYATIAVISALVRFGEDKIKLHPQF